MCIRQARLEPLAWGASGHERTVNGWATHSEIEGLLVEIGSRSVFGNSAFGSRQ